MATAQAATAVEINNPVFVQKLIDDYKSKISHVFILYGNINDFSDNSGKRHGILHTLAQAFDDNIKKQLGRVGEKADRVVAGPTAKSREMIRIFATYNLSGGLEFLHEDSKTQMLDALRAFYTPQVWDEGRDDWKQLKPANKESMFGLMNAWFHASKEVAKINQQARANNLTTRQEILFTLTFTDSDALFPDGTIAQMVPDREAIVHMRNWARDENLGDRNRIILMTRHLTELHESIRGGTSGVSTISVPKPTMSDRQEWLENFSKGVEERVASRKKPMVIGSNEVTKVELAEGFDFTQFAVQSAGMSRRQMEDVIMKSWLNKTPIDFFMVKERKQRAIEDEYQGIVDFFEPEFGFEHIGGHDALKTYFQRKVIGPLRTGDKRLCTSGMLMTGPPGTGKTALARATAKEAKLNFMVGHLDKLFGSLVGETEQKTRKFLEAVESAAPCIVFLDELDSVLSSGRSSKGDSGTSARMFNAVMQWLSDDSRKGKVVVIAASNRPDLLDAALIRAGRFDALIPALPPSKGDVKGRLQILAALCRKLKITFAADLAKTESDESTGLGRLLGDKKRVWTGAEIEVVLKEAFDNAAFASRNKTVKSKVQRDYTITMEDWNKAMDDILPDTKMVERMTLLSLLYVNHLGYCPPEWRDKAKDKEAIRQELGIQDN
jgi:transitional endoplasmic reticulum ATPase